MQKIIQKKEKKYELHITLLKRMYVCICTYVMLRAIWYNLYSLKNVKSTHGRVLLLV